MPAQRMAKTPQDSTALPPPTAHRGYPVAKPNPRPGQRGSPRYSSAIGVVADRWPCTELTRCLYFTLVVEALSGANPSQTIGPQYPAKS